MNKCAVVTGGSRGLGLEVSRQLLHRGHVVYVGVRTVTPSLKATFEPFAERAKIRVLDVTKADAVTRLAKEIEENEGGLDILINNAAVHYDTWQTASRADLRIASEAIETNLLGVWRMCVALSPLMGKLAHGVIVNVSSGAGALETIEASAPAYSVSKAALNALTISLARDLTGRNILVNAVCPGWVATDMGGSGGRSIEDGARGIVWAASLAADGPTGGFFRDGKRLSWLQG